MSNTSIPIPTININETKIKSRKNFSSILSKYKLYICGTVLALVISVAIMALYIIDTNIKTIEWRLHELKNQTNTLLLQQNYTKRQIDSQKKLASIVELELHAKISAINLELQAIYKQHPYDTSAWILIKARNQLELAQLNTPWNHDLKSSLILLKNLNKSLDNIDALGIPKIKQLLSQEIERLQNLDIPDTLILLTKLDEVLNKISHLSLKRDLHSIDKNNNAKLDNQNTPSWRKNFARSLELLKHLIIIHHQDLNTIPVLSPAYEFMLRTGLGFSIQAAQLAVLENNEIEYQLLLKQSIENINRLFKAPTPELESLLLSLYDLQKRHLNPQTPELKLPLALINQLIKTQINKPNAYNHKEHSL